MAYYQGFYWLSVIFLMSYTFHRYQIQVPKHFQETYQSLDLNELK